MSKLLPKGTIIMYKPECKGMEFDYKKFIDSSRNGFIDLKAIPSSYTSDPYDFYMDYDSLGDDDWIYRKMPARIEQFHILGPKSFEPENKYKMLVVDVKLYRFNTSSHSIVFYECLDFDNRYTRPDKLTFFVNSHWVVEVTEDCANSVDYIKKKILDRIKSKRNI